MPALAFLIPGDPSTRTGGYEYDRRMADGLRSRGWQVSAVALDGSFPRPTKPALAHADAALAALPDGALVLLDGLALGAMPDQAGAHAARLRLVGLVHHPLALETGLDLATAIRLRASERRALEYVRGVVVTSRRTAETLDEFGVAADRIAVIEPGTDWAPLARGSSDGVLQLLCVASLSPRKGHDVLLRALAGVRGRSWRLVCVGSTTRDPDTARGLRELVRELGLTDHVLFAGEADADTTGACYAASDVFVLPTWYEGYGMVVAEALARGLPVVATPTGAIPDLLGGEAGLLVGPGDVPGWTDALERLFDPAQRARLAAGARVRREAMRTWEAAADELVEALVRHG